MGNSLVVCIGGSKTTHLILKYFLGRHDITCLTFSDGMEALDALQRQPVPSVIFLTRTLTSPREDSSYILDEYEIARLLRSNEGYSRTPIIMFTKRTDVVSRIQAHLAGVSLVLPKEIHTQKLLAHISSYVELPSDLDDSNETPPGGNDDVQRPHRFFPAMFHDYYTRYTCHSLSGG